MDKRAAWDRFWRYDRLSSFGTGRGAGNYGEPIAAGWRTFFAALPAGSRVLDLCTGNGAIAVIAVEAGDGLQVAGADLAAVRPALFVSGKKAELSEVQFLPNTPAEELPLADASLDAVVSQYGIEYSDMDRSLPEAVRVLAPGGRLRLAVHAAEGSVAALTGAAIADATFLIDEVGLVARARECITAVLTVERGRARSPFAQSDAQKVYLAFREALRAVAARAATAADSAMLASVHGTLTELFQQRQSHGDAAISSKLDDLQSEIEAHRERERALLAAALTREQLKAMTGCLASLGLTAVALSEQRDGEALLGHVIEASCPG
jgi:SAM-dependent methyltransferase